MASNSAGAVLPAATLYVDVDQDWYHTSYIFTGLSLLAKSNGLQLKVRHPVRTDWRKSAPQNARVHLDLHLSEPGGPLSLCFDLADRSDVFFHTSLQGCRIYFKRSYHQPDVDRLAPEHRDKVWAFGMNYACADRSSCLAVLRGIAGHLRAENRRSLLHDRQRLGKIAKRVVRYSRLPRPDQFEHAAELPKKPFVLFQPRLWEERHVRGEDVEAVNESRVRIVRLLRQALGPRFRGGLVPTRLARERYPELISDIPPRRYLEHTRQALVGVSTRGLHFSTPWKLAEYLAATVCVVGEPIRNDVGAPLEPGRHYLPSSSPDECVEHCVRILAEPDLQSELRNAAHEYYRSQIEPAAHLRNCIQAAAAVLV